MNGNRRPPIRLSLGVSALQHTLRYYRHAFSQRWDRKLMHFGKSLLATGAWTARTYWSLRARVGIPEKLCVILPSYNRPWNMAPLVRAALHTEFVERVVVTNNHPQVNLGR